MDNMRDYEKSYIVIWMKSIGLRRNGRLVRPIRPSPSLRLCASGWLILSCIFSVHALSCQALSHHAQFSVRSILKIFSRPRAAAPQILTGFASRIFLSQRSQFLHKISTLLELVENLNEPAPTPPKS